MENIIEKMLKLGVGNFMDASRYQLADNDEVYQQAVKDSAEMRERFQKMDLRPEVRNFIEEYITCISSESSRYSDLSYMAGIRDCIQLLSALDVLKKAEVEKDVSEKE
jgi:hypothetical protein